MGVDHQIEYFNRATGRVETEEVYGEAYLRFVYGNPLGKLALHALVKRAIFSRWYGWMMDRNRSRAKVAPFVDKYKIDIAEHAEPLESYKTFNEFFYRKLTPDARPVHPDPDSAIFPADGRHLCYPDVDAISGVFVKGQKLNLQRLIGDADLAKRFVGGAMVFSRLCPVDYHRFHFPVAGTPSRQKLINGPLFSVNPIALRRNAAILWENKRSRCLIQSKTFGRVLTIEVGATCVGGIEHTYQPEQFAEKGEEKGFFRFGGSATITLFEAKQIVFDSDLLLHSGEFREVYAKMGDRMGITAI